MLAALVNQEKNCFQINRSRGDGMPSAALIMPALRANALALC